MAMPGYCMQILAVVVVVFGIKVLFLEDVFLGVPAVIPAVILWAVAGVVSWLGVKMIHLENR